MFLSAAHTLTTEVIYGSTEDLRAADLSFTTSGLIVFLLCTVGNVSTVLHTYSEQPALNGFRKMYCIIAYLAEVALLESSDLRNSSVSFKLSEIFCSLDKDGRL